MKNLFTLITLALSSATGMAQITAGSSILSGTASFTSRQSEISNTETNYTWIDINAGYGYFFNERFAGHILLNYNSFTSENNSESSQSSTSENIYGLRMGIGYYKPLVDKLYFTTLLTGGFGMGKTTYNTSNDSYESDYRGDITRYEAQATPGLLYFFTPGFGVSLSIGSVSYMLTETDYETEGISDRSEAVINLNYRLGGFGLHFML